jgi:hypothetical protein
LVFISAVRFINNFSIAQYVILRFQIKFISVPACYVLIGPRFQAISLMTSEYTCLKLWFPKQKKVRTNTTEWETGWAAEPFWALTRREENVSSLPCWFQPTA